MLRVSHYWPNLTYSLHCEQDFMAMVSTSVAFVKGTESIRAVGKIRCIQVGLSISGSVRF